MSKTLFITALGASVLLFAGCKKKPDVAVSGGETVAITPDNAGENVTGFTKAEYMKACQQAMTETQCNCFVDFYDSIGLKVTELGDSAKIQAKMASLSPEKAAEAAKCMN